MKRNLQITAGSLLTIIILFVALNLLAEPILNPIFLGYSIGGELLSEDFVYSSKPDIPYTWTKNYNTEKHKYCRCAIATNSDGFRTDSFKKEKTTPRIMLLGDSIAFGVYLEANETLESKIEESLAGLGYKVDVFSLGIPTYMMAAKVGTFKAYLDIIKPDIVILQSKVWDFNNTEPFVGKKWARRLPLLYWGQLRLHRRSLVTISEDKGRADYYSLVNECKSNNIPLVVLLFPFLIESQFNGNLKELLMVFKESGVHLIDVFFELGKTGKPYLSFQAMPNDTIHPNKEAIDITVKALIPWLVTQLPPIQTEAD